MLDIYSFGPHERTDFYELYQQQKFLKITEINKVSPDTYNKGYLPQPQPSTTHKFWKQEETTSWQNYRQELSYNKREIIGSNNIAYHVKLRNPREIYNSNYKTIISPNRKTQIQNKS